MEYVYYVLAVAALAGAGYVGYAYGRKVEATAQQVLNASKSGINAVKKVL